MVLNMRAYLCNGHGSEYVIMAIAVHRELAWNMLGKINDKNIILHLTDLSHLLPYLHMYPSLHIKYNKKTRQIARVVPDRNILCMH